MVGVRGRGTGRGPGWAGLRTGEVLLRRAFPRGTHDLRRENTADSQQGVRSVGKTQKPHF